MKRALLIIFLVAVIVGSFGYAIRRLQEPKPGFALPPNILVVSFCSFRMQMLSRYGGKNPELLPSMESFMSNASYVFDNVYNGMPWTGVFSFTRQRIPKDVFKSLGYWFLGTVEDGHAERIPNRRTRLKIQNSAETNDNDYEKNLAGVTEYLGSLVQSPGRRPFYGIFHYKYLHFPFIDRFNADSEWDRFLSVAERNQISEYLNHPEKYPEKLPFLLLLANDPKIALAHPEVRARHWKEDASSARQLTGLLANSKFVKAWKDSAGFKDDLRLLKAVYSANVQYLDSILNAPLTVWGNKGVADDTVVIMVGDHGEMHMERDTLTHASVLFDDALHIPMAIKFPKHWGSQKVIKDQMHLMAVAKMIEGIMKGEIRDDNLPEKVKELNGDTVVLRDCVNSLRGLRVKNKYKYFVDIASGERFLFDLEKDPGELRNIAEDEPERTDELEALYWEKYPEFSDIFPYFCANWGPVPAKYK